MKLHQANKGLSLVELLLALAVFGIVLAIAYGAITGSLRIQSDQEAVTTAQGKLRRVVEVLTQDLRSAVFGSIANAPYGSDENQVSFMMLTGGAGYPVLAPDWSIGFSEQNEIVVQIPDASHLVNREVVMINGVTGQGIVLPVNRATSHDGNWRLQSHCKNAIAYALNSTLMFEVETVGLRHDESEQAIFTTIQGNREVPFAFGISDFRIDYVYTSPTGELRVQGHPEQSDNGVPTRSFVDGGDIYTLERVQFMVAANADSGTDIREVSYVGQVDLSRTDAEHFQVEELLPCR